MSLPLLTIIPAGAGSGKTHTIQTRLAQWVKDGLVRPEKIVAVTFTEAAAAELRDRIRAELVKQGRTEAALRLDQAYISTIHGFGLRIITEFAFEAGLSPMPRLLNDDEKDVLIRLALARTEKADIILENLTEYGYAYDFNSGESPEDQFRGAVLGLIEKLRSVGRIEGGSVLIPYALRKIEILYGATGPEETLKQDFLDAVQALLEKFPADISGNYDKKSVIDELKQNFRDLKKAQAGGLESDWALWQRLRCLRVSNRQTKMPPGYDDLAQAVMDAANELPRHPGPLNDAKQHAGALLGAAQDALAQYAGDKREKALVDYADMVALAQAVLASRSDVLDELRKRVDCLVIDEFQDTNPLQFSLLWALHEAKVPTLIVGDLKQAIMGFQNADARLLAQLQTQFAGATDPLKKNWRSTPALMKWINAVGAGLFGKSYTPLTPEAKYPSGLAPLELIEFAERPAYGKAAIPAQYTALRIKAILDDPAQKVYDKHAGRQRRIRGGDIAVLCPTNARLTLYAEALRSIGIRTRIEQDGWFESRIVQIACHALSFVADPSDAHAALYLAVTELGNRDLDEALREIIRSRTLDAPFLDKLREVGALAADKTVDTLAAETISAIDLFGVVARWPDAAQARANLLRLPGEAREFMGANREALASGGFYGAGLKTFLSWLNKKQEIDNSQPASRVQDEDAVQLMTWHKSKGKEWPVVAVCGMDYKAEARLPSFDVEFEDFSDLNKIIEKAKIVISPAFAAPETAESCRLPLQREKEIESLRLLYVALTRAREKVILEWPGHLAGKEGCSYWHILTNATKMELKEDELVIGKDRFVCLVTRGGKDTPAEFEKDMPELVEPLPVIGRRAIAPEKLPQNLTPEAVTPSSMHGEGSGKITGLVTETYGSGMALTGDLGPMERGIILHWCFEVMGTRDLPIDVAKKAMDYDFSDLEYQGVRKAVAEFDAWLEKKFSPLDAHREVPILALNSDGSVVSGVVDLILETTEGLWILDHKTDTSDDLDTLFGNYLPQLQAYKDAVEKAMEGKKVLGVGINWVRYGSISKLDVI